MLCQPLSRYDEGVKEVIVMKLGEKIMYSRKRAGMSQIDLADALGVSRQSVSKWETGEANPDITKLPQLANVLGVTADWLLSDEDPADGYQDPYRRNEEYGGGASAAPQKTYPDWIDHLPGFMLKVVKKFGWIYGVFIAVIGAVFAGFGLLIRVLAGNTVFGGASSDPLSFGYDPFYQINQTSWSGFSTISTAVMILGGLIMLFGIILAITLKKWGSKNKAAD